MDLNNYFVDEIKERDPIKINVSYPRSDEYEFFSEIEKINLDLECQNDINTGNGFVITSSPKNSNKKEMKNYDGIYSTRFGAKIGDANAFSDRYSCECGATQGRVKRNTVCEFCKKKVKFVSDNFHMYGWIVLKDKYHFIHPAYYETLNYLFGSSQYNIEKKKVKGTKLDNMLNYSPEVDNNGKVSPCTFKPDKEPFYGIGMMEFYDRFDEILNYYYKLNPKKQDYYNEIINHRDLVFCHCVPVFTTHLRPSDVRDNFMCYEPSNAMYNMINKHVHSINKDTRKLNQDPVIKNAHLFKAQKKYMDLVNMIITNLQGKKGNFRKLIAGRYNFSSRAVIRQDASLRCDQILLPYVELVITNQQTIINILMRTYNLSPSQAYEIWDKGRTAKDPRICEILDAIIKASPNGGIPILINRNPTINFGSILLMHCVGYTDTLTMSVPLQVLKSLAADFDGDVLNILHLVNKSFIERAEQIFNPRNAMYISKVDGKMNGALMIQRDTVINANTLYHLGENNDEDVAILELIKEKQKQYFVSNQIMM